MTEPTNDNFVIDYAIPVIDPLNLFIAPMRRWRSVCCPGTVVTGVGLFLWLPLAVGGAVAAFVTGAFSLNYMWHAARAEVDAGYATRQIVLAILISFFIFTGVWLMPVLVESDLEKWRRVEDRERPGGE